MTTYDLPSGFTTLDELAATSAGRVWILHRTFAKLETGGTAGISAAANFYAQEWKQIDTAVPPHPECYALRFEDGSLYIRSNADDEVWADENDFLDHYGLTEKDGAYVPTEEANA